MECNEHEATAPAPAPLYGDTLLVVDDDDEIRELLCDYLSEAGYRVLAAADGEQMWQHLQSEPVSLLVLDLMLPGDDGLSLCRQLQGHRDLAVIMLSARGSALDRVIGLEVGADDYVTKPFEPRELLARIKAVLRRSARPEAEHETGLPRSQTFAGHRLDHARRLLVLADRHEVALPRSDYRILSELLAAPERILCREQLTRSAFGRDYQPDDRSVDMCISRLRQHFKSSSGVEIVTLRNEGYLLSLANR
ncbi:response regulator transcription factor [Pseudomonas sp. DTU_2021_1001937_2_SI_NGA_ILE_001]|uniref:response regulator n=1 Tax=Pseudomonas sp. DTU_2021_1001937_2_SI_NGA_ILE_001 TaxID=3077589 RepID=UPI0025D72CD3|nr:response regulator transcription factor [Pseudomonas sp. DTU_2021_1001937_2_SI_NGA_ILE_001]WNW12726.1 response regulator transcription factor [Pseudomonas sp. DTU_2021_1001937_2_SI_NGA_ILE_001]